MTCPGRSWQPGFFHFGKPSRVVQGLRTKASNAALVSAIGGLQLTMLVQPPIKWISYIPDLEVAFFVIVTTSKGLSYVEAGFVLICASDLLCILKPDFSAHWVALAHFASQSGPAWHKILGGRDALESPAPSPPAQLDSPKKEHATIPKRKTCTVSIRGYRSNSGSLAIFAAMRRASSRVIMWRRSSRPVAQSMAKER